MGMLQLIKSSLFESQITIRQSIATVAVYEKNLFVFADS